MPDYTSHLPKKNEDWWEKYKQELGTKQLLEYVNIVYLLFSKMKPDSFFSIEKNVKEKNRDLFIKICCMFIDETVHTPPESGYYEFNSECTVLKYVAIIKNKTLINDNNRRSVSKNKQRP
jgi:hypothetical protein